MEVVHIQRAIVEDGDGLHDCAALFSDQLPRNNVRVMLQFRDQNLVAGLQVLSAPRLRDQVDAFGRVLGQDGFALFSIHEGRDLGAGCFKGVRGFLAQRVNAPMNIRVRRRHEVVHGVSHGQRLLR